MHIHIHTNMQVHTCFLVADGECVHECVVEREEAKERMQWTMKMRLLVQILEPAQAVEAGLTLCPLCD